VELRRVDQQRQDRPALGAAFVLTRESSPRRRPCGLGVVFAIA
jgi:hypothetical protein